MTASEKEYGMALYELAAEESCEDEVLQSIVAVADLLKEHPQYQALLQNPSVPKNERLSLLDRAFSEQIHIYALNFVKILCSRRALNELSGCEQAFREQMYAARGILPAVAYSAVKLTQEQAQSLCEKLEAATGKKVQLENKIEPSVLGGVKICYEGKELDGTIAGRMGALRRTLTQA